MDSPNTLFLDHYFPSDALKIVKHISKIPHNNEDFITVSYKRSWK
ncbi:hypothetical protein ACIZ62_05885 [Acetobacterium carbinolicum]